eukprot:m.235734 g.235734  ORF g.235734 m.235734 type:complete len:62 (+) comp40128_c0_seq86:593-778(+)
MNPPQISVRVDERKESEWRKASGGKQEVGLSDGLKTVAVGDLVSGTTIAQVMLARSKSRLA